MPNDVQNREELIAKYADLLVNYCIEVKKGDKIFVRSSYLAEDLLQRVAEEVYRAGGIPVFDIEIRGLNKALMDYADKEQLAWVNPMKKYVIEHFDGYLNIRAPFVNDHDEQEPAHAEKFQVLQQAQQEINRIYFNRIGDGSMRRCLCQYPTQAGADDAEMTLAEYEEFVFGACRLYAASPVEQWLAVRREQQTYADYLNGVDRVSYRGPNIDITFSVKGRKWMNSDGRANMPSGEVFSAPIEDSVNGWAYFSYPSRYLGKDVKGIRLEVKNGEVVQWKAEQGQDVLDKVFTIAGARHWGEVAIGTNYNIQRTTRNILFDEKIGGSIHMAVGQSYKQCGGKNESTVHWDMITDMKNGGEIIADGIKIYENGKFLL